MAFSLPDSLKYEKRGGTCYITMNRPGSMNALNLELQSALGTAFEEFDADDSLYVAVITGEGGRAFSAGGDLKEQTTYVGTDDDPRRSGAQDGPSMLDGKPFPKNNEGHSGYTIDPAPAVNRSGISPLVAASLKKNTPHIVTLMIGTNDIGTNNDVANAPTRLGNLIDIITSTSPNALLVVAQITPPGDNTGNGRAQTYNAAIPGLVKTRVAAGKHIIVVDMYAPLAGHPDYMNGLHPNDTGYDFMGDIWYKALTPYL